MSRVETHATNGAGEKPTAKEVHIAGDLQGVIAAMQCEGVSTYRVGCYLAGLIRGGNHHDTHLALRDAADRLAEIAGRLMRTAAEVERADAEVGRQIAEGTHPLSPLAVLGQGEYTREVMP